MKIEKLKIKFQILSAIKLVIPLFIGLLIALAGYYFTQQNAVNIEDSDILYVRKGDITPGIVHLSHPPAESFSFFINIFITSRQGQLGSCIVLVDQINKFTFLIGSDGIPVIRWKSKKILSSRDEQLSISKNHKVSRNQWYHLGFIYQEDKVTLYINGDKCGEAVTNEKISLSQIEFLPGMSKSGTMAIPIIGKATYPILLSRAISQQHILDLQKGTRLYHHLTVKIFSLFLFGFVFAYFALTQFLLPLISLRKPCYPTVYQVLRNILFVFSLHLIFFLLFNPGYNAARYINNYFGKYGLWTTSVYFTMLVMIGFLFLLWYTLRKVTKVPDRKCLIYIGGVTSLFIFTISLCLLPHFDDIYPFIFNGIFSLLFSLVVAAPDILWILNMIKVDDELQQDF